MYKHDTDKRPFKYFTFPAQVDACFMNKLIERLHHFLSASKYGFTMLHISVSTQLGPKTTQDASASGGDEFGPQGPRAPDVMVVRFGPQKMQKNIVWNKIQ